MKDKVIKQLGHSIENITICVGEQTLILPTLEKLLTFIVDKHIRLNAITMTINGTNYSEELLRLLDYIDEYILKRKAETLAPKLTFTLHTWPIIYTYLKEHDVMKWGH